MNRSVKVGLLLVVVCALASAALPGAIVRTPLKVNQFQVVGTLVGVTIDSPELPPTRIFLTAHLGGAVSLNACRAGDPFACPTMQCNVARLNCLDTTFHGCYLFLGRLRAEPNNGVSPYQSELVLDGLQLISVSPCK